MKRISVVGLSVVLALLAGCGGSKAPLTDSTPGIPTGSLRGRIATTNSRQATPSRFFVRLHDSDTSIAVQVDTDGTFQLDNVPAGQQTVTIEDRQTFQGAVVVCFIRPGELTDIGEVMPKPLGKIAGIVREVDENGNLVKPVARARVFAHPFQTEQEALQDLSERPVFATRTDTNGSYELLVPAGNYLVEVRHPDYEPTAQTATVQELSTTALDFSLQLRDRQTGAVVGVVQAQWNGQTVPVAGAFVALMPKGSQLQPLNVGSVVSTLAPSKSSRQHPLFTFTEADGSFELTGVPAGDYTAFAFKKGFGQDRKDITVQANATVQVTFLLQAQLGLIQGKVTDAKTGQPIAGATVVALRIGDPFWDWDDWQKFLDDDDRKGGKPKWHRPKGARPNTHQLAPHFPPPLPPFEPPVRVGTLTDANGNYRLPVPAGTYFVSAGVDGYEWQAQEVTVTLNALVTADFALNKTPAIAGVQVQLEIEHTVRVGEPVTMRLKVANKSNQSVTLTFMTGQRYDFVVTTPDRRILWVWSHGKAFTQAVNSLTLSPEQDVEFEEEWDQRDNDGNPLPPGDYWVYGVLTTDPAVKTDPQPLRLLP